MPLYAYEYTDDEGGDFEVFQKMKEDHLTAHEGRPCRRTVTCPNVRTQYGAGSHTDAIEMYSIALNNKKDIEAFAKRNPNTQISTNRRDPLYGVPVVKSRSEKLKVLDNEGFVETN